ncbi:MAG: M28 family peptidase [Actinomycetia bacterium]|nr:M28 family peptidase [Actinomycetes bacterium]
MAQHARSQASPPTQRPRRGFPDRPVNGRIYRTLCLVVLIPAAIAALSVREAPLLPAAGLPLTFDGEKAVALTRTFASTFPNRTPGTDTAQGAAEWVAWRLVETGLRVERHVASVDLPELGRVPIVNIVGTTRARRGSSRSSDTIIVVAHRDNRGESPGANDNASGTGVLIELARELGTVSLDHTLVFVSTDAGAFGNAGALQLARDGARDPTSLFSRERALAVVNLDSLSGPGPARLGLGGDTAAFPSPSLAASADAAVIAQTEERARTPNPLAQLIDLAFPLSLSDQAPFLDAGVSAITLSAAGDRPPRPDTDVPEALDGTLVATLGSAAQGLVASLGGAAEVARGTDSYLYVSGRAIRGWAVGLTLLAALLPPIGAVIDLFARARARGSRVAAGLRSYRSRLLFWLWVAGLVGLVTFLGALPSGSGRPLPPDSHDAQTWSAGALAAVGIVGAAGWLLARNRIARRAEMSDASELGGHIAGMLALIAVSLAVAIVQPFALIFVLPSLHVWLWLPHVRQGAFAVRVAVLALGLLGPALLLGSVVMRFDLGLDAPWYLLTLVTTGHAPISLFVLFAAWLAAAAQLSAYTLGLYAPYAGPDERPQLGPVRSAVRATILSSRWLRRVWRRAGAAR